MLLFVRLLIWEVLSIIDWSIIVYFAPVILSATTRASCWSPQVDSTPLCSLIFIAFRFYYSVVLCNCMYISTPLSDCFPSVLLSSTSSMTSVPFLSFYLFVVYPPNFLLLIWYLFTCSSFFPWPYPISTRSLSLEHLANNVIAILSNFIWSKVKIVSNARHFTGTHKVKTSGHLDVRWRQNHYRSGLNHVETSD